MAVGSWRRQCRSRTVRRWYRGPTLALETEFTTADGVASVIDFMPIRSGRADLVRIVVGRLGKIPMRTELVIRFDYGSVVPWVRRIPQGIFAVAGPDSLLLRTPVALHGEQFRTVADFVVGEGERVPFDMTWFPSHLQGTPELDPHEALHQTEDWWKEWSARCTVDGPWRDAVLRSLITLKALTYRPTGAIVAAPTMGCPNGSVESATGLQRTVHKPHSGNSHPPGLATTRGWQPDHPVACSGVPACTLPTSRT